MKQDRFLIGILIAIGVLVVASLVVFAFRNQPQDYLPDDTPEGVIHNYVLAIQNGDYERAYEYLADKAYKPSFVSFRSNVAIESNRENYGIQILDSVISGDEASVNLSIIYVSGDPFSSGWRSEEMALLVKQDGLWKIESMPYQYWYWDWYSKP